MYPNHLLVKEGKTSELSRLFWKLADADRRKIKCACERECFADLKKLPKREEGLLDYRILYGETAAGVPEARYRAVAKGFRSLKGCEPEAFYSSSGRAEIIGNHTDHNGGKVIVAAISCDIVAAVKRRGDGLVEIASKGFRPVRFQVSDTARKRAETGRSASLARGVAAGIERLGYSLKDFGGFSAYTESTVFRGAGVSSSAAFEVLIAEIFNDLHLNGKMTPSEKAEVGRFAENEYFGKPCGLLDQSGVAYGGLNKIDFRNSSAPSVSSLPLPKGYSLVITNTGGSHSELTEYYAAIRGEMSEVAAFFGKRTLREINENSLLNALPSLRKKVSERAILRAFHFFEENVRVDRAAEALRRGDMSAFLNCMKESGESSQKYLQNCFVPNSDVQPVSLALKLSEKLLKNGGYRLHGGGFAGTVLACVSDAEKEKYIRAMARVFGRENVFPAAVRKVGTVRVNF